MKIKEDLEKFLNDFSFKYTKENEIEIKDEFIKVKVTQDKNLVSIHLVEKNNENISCGFYLAFFREFPEIYNIIYSRLYDLIKEKNVNEIEFISTELRNISYFDIFLKNFLETCLNKIDNSFKIFEGNGKFLKNKNFPEIFTYGYLIRRI